MKKLVFAKAITAILLSIILGWLGYLDQLRESKLGKVAFLKKESDLFDQDLLHPNYVIILGALFLGIILFGLYELICFLILKIIKKI